MPPEPELNGEGLMPTGLEMESCLASPGPGRPPKSIDDLCNPGPAPFKIVYPNKRDAAIYIYKPISPKLQNKSHNCTNHIMQIIQIMQIMQIIQIGGRRPEAGC